MSRLTKNSAQCRVCGDTIESKHQHDWVQCSCEAIFIDGGLAYRRAGGNSEDFIDLCEYEETL